MKRINLEIAVGFFLLFGLASLSYLIIKLGNERLIQPGSYTINARFESISGLSEGADVEIAGVAVGKVAKIHLDNGEYEAVVEMTIDQDVELQDDTIASVRSSGIIGDKYVKITPGGSEDLLQPGDTITDTESSISIEELVSKYIFESDKKAE